MRDKLFFIKGNPGLMQRLAHLLFQGSDGAFALREPQPDDRDRSTRREGTKGSKLQGEGRKLGGHRIKDLPKGGQAGFGEFAQKFQRQMAILGRGPANAARGVPQRRLHVTDLRLDRW